MWGLGPVSALTTTNRVTWGDEGSGGSSRSSPTANGPDGVLWAAVARRRLKRGALNPKP